MNSGSLITRQPHDGKIKVFANDLMKRPSRNGRFLFICKNSWKSVFIVIAVKFISTESGTPLFNIDHIRSFNDEYSCG